MNSPEPVLRLFSQGLLSKWGFSDGDTPDWLLDYCDDHGIDYPQNWHRVLAALVRRYLLPALDQEVTVTEIETIHNPIRAETVNGTDVTDRWYDGTDSVALSPDVVDLPVAEVLRLARELKVSS